MIAKHYRIVLAGYLVRYPLGGYAWQVAHYLLGFRALGHDVWFYEDTSHYAPAYNPVTNEFGTAYDYGIAAAADFLERIGFGDRWVFVDTGRGVENGPGAGRIDALFRQADLFVNLGGTNFIPAARHDGKLAAYIDIDPAYTQLKLDSGDQFLRAILDEHAYLFTFGENIGTSRSPLPTAGYLWHATRQPVVTELWANIGPPGPAYTTVGKWDSRGRDLVYQGETFQWRKRAQWLHYLDLPKCGPVFEVAMDVESVAGDIELLVAHGWRVVDPLTVSTNPWRYRDYLCGSRGEFTIAKDQYVRLRSGWFSDRSACYLAAGRPVITQDTGFGDVLPLGPGLHAFRTVEDASDAVRLIEADYERSSAHATEVAQEYFAAEKVLGRLLREVGL